MMDKAFGEKMVAKFEGLIRSASSMYYRKCRVGYMDYGDFVGRGFLTLATCLAKWTNPNDEEGFTKYFKTSLYYKYQSMLSKAYAQKRTGQRISIDDLTEVAAEEDFDTEFKELVDHIMSCLKNELERKIFKIWVDPPPELCDMSVLENQRKMKIATIRKAPVPGTNKVRLNNGLVIQYLKAQGYNISVQTYNTAFKELKDKVKKIVEDGALTATGAV